MSIKEVMNNFLTHSVRIQEQMNQNKSRDFFTLCLDDIENQFAFLPFHIVIPTRCNI